MKKYVLIFSMAAFFLNACQNEVDLAVDKPIDIEALARPTEPEIDFEFNTPGYPVKVIYVLQQEFKNLELDSDSEELSEIAYIESRLLELYPDKGYKGMLSDDQKLLDEYLEKYSAYESELKVYEQQMGIESIEEEPVDFTDIELTDIEAETFHKLNDIALEKVNRKEMNILLTETTNLQRGPITNAIIIGNMTGVALLVNVNAALVLLAEDRANSLAATHYPNDIGDNGAKWDAFKHVYASMHLRRYQGKAIAKIVMEYWEGESPNIEARDTRMDLHNNVIGRDTRYDLFRGSFLGDFSNWQQWGRNVRDYLNGCTNGMPMDQLFDWKNSAPSTRQAIFNISSQPYNNIRFVYYSETCSISPCWGVNCATGYVCVNGSCIPDPNYGGCPNVPCPPGTICAQGTCIEL